jgi:predicted trehalose synthase
VAVAESAESDAVAAGGNDADGLKSTPTESVPSPLPGEEAEAAFLAEARERGEDVASVAAALAAAEGEDEKVALPPLEELVAKLPTELRDTLDDLFRAKFAKVIRVRKSDLPA